MTAYVWAISGYEVRLFPARMLMNSTDVSPTTSYASNGAASFICLLAAILVFVLRLCGKFVYRLALYPGPAEGYKNW